MNETCKYGYLVSLFNMFSVYEIVIEVKEQLPNKAGFQMFNFVS